MKIEKMRMNDKRMNQEWEIMLFKKVFTIALSTLDTDSKKMILV